MTASAERHPVRPLQALGPIRYRACMSNGPAGSTLRILPLTPERFPDLERLFGTNGASCGCWCMWWRLSTAEFRAAGGDGNRRALRRYVRAGRVPGLLAYDGSAAVGWVAVEPRACYPRLARSRNLAEVDDAPVWSITCFYVDRRHRGRGIVRALIEAAAGYARAAGAGALEAYPREPSPTAVDSTLYTGVPSTFRRLGFAEVARRVPSRPVMRLALTAPLPRTPVPGSPPRRGRSGSPTPRPVPPRGPRRAPRSGRGRLRSGRG